MRPYENRETRLGDEVRERMGCFFFFFLFFFLGGGFCGRRKRIVGGRDEEVGGIGVEIMKGNGRKNVTKEKGMKDGKQGQYHEY